MKAKHTVKVNGEWYKAGVEIPALNHNEQKMTEIMLNEPAKVAEEDKMTKSRIITMNVEGLRELAAKHGVEDAVNLTGSRLKEILIEKLGL